MYNLTRFSIFDVKNIFGYLKTILSTKTWAKEITYRKYVSKFERENEQEGVNVTCTVSGIITPEILTP